MASKIYVEKKRKSSHWTSRKTLAMKNIFLHIFAYSLLALQVLADGKLDKVQLPSFLEPINNVTVAVGRDASLDCVVDNLGDHKVAWVHLDRKMVVAIHKQVVSRVQRFVVTHDSHKTWTIHITRVTENDKGFYMCQVNTTPMISQQGYLDVVVPPNILDESSSGSTVIVREKGNVTLTCVGEGFPLPQIRWMREGGSEILLSNGKKVKQFEGESLVMKSVSREQTGPYLCIASNGVPPSVSKRITLEVEFSPELHVENQLIGAAISSDVQLECDVQANPRPVTFWWYSDNMISNSSRQTSQIIANGYRYKLILTIKDIRKHDFGSYLCVAKNSFAETNGSIKLSRITEPTRPPEIFRKEPYPDRMKSDQQRMRNSAKNKLSNSAIYPSREASNSKNSFDDYRTSSESQIENSQNSNLDFFGSIINPGNAQDVSSRSSQLQRSEVVKLLVSSVLISILSNSLRLPILLLL